MAEVVPFAGIHYNPSVVPIDQVIAPPYDVISPELQEALFARNSHNIVRLILNRDGADASDTRYARSAAFLQESLDNGTLVQDETPALYEYVQEFEHPNDPSRIVKRTTLLVALKLEPYEKGIVLPHEETHPKAKADRLELMKSTEANAEPIYGLYEDPAQEAADILNAGRPASPLLDARLPGRSGTNTERHTLFAHTDPQTVAALTAFFAPLRIWIADGHHRYETALNYKQLRGEGTPADYIFIGLSAFEDPGLVVLPTHRMVKNVSAQRLEQLALQLDRYFEVHPRSYAEARAWIHEHAPGQKRFAILASEGAAYTLTLRDMSILAAATQEGHCDAWRELDVTILQTLVLDRTLGISWTALAHTPDVAYTRDEEEAATLVRSGEYQLACLLQDPTVTEVRDVASAGDKMPQKSTFFYPKLWSGLLVRSLQG